MNLNSGYGIAHVATHVGPEMRSFAGLVYNNMNHTIKILKNESNKKYEI